MDELHDHHKFDHYTLPHIIHGVFWLIEVCFTGILVGLAVYVGFRWVTIKHGDRRPRRHGGMTAHERNELRGALLSIIVGGMVVPLELLLLEVFHWDFLALWFYLPPLAFSLSWAAASRTPVD